QVDRDRAEAGLAERDELVAPGPPELGEAVQQQHERPVAAFGDVEPRPVRAHRAVRPRPVDVDRVTAARGHGYPAGEDPATGVASSSPRRRRAEMSLATVPRVLGSPLIALNRQMLRNTPRMARMMQLPATMRNEIEPGMPSSISA